MKKIIKSIVPILSVTVLTGCTTTKTLEDFYNMSSQSRAMDVCNNANAERIALQTITQIDTEINSTVVSITERNQALERGYRVHKSCTSTPNNNTITTCNKDPFTKQVTCREQKDPWDWSKTTTCTETPVAIDADYEERKIKELTSRLSELKTDRAFKDSDRNNQWDDCIVRVKTLPIAEAHLHYMNKTRP